MDVWSVGCILAELLRGEALFKGHDIVSQLDLILSVCGTPSEEAVRRICSTRVSFCPEPLLILAQHLLWSCRRLTTCESILYFLSSLLTV